MCIAAVEKKLKILKHDFAAGSEYKHQDFPEPVIKQWAPMGWKMEVDTLSSLPRDDLRSLSYALDLPLPPPKPWKKRGKKSLLQPLSMGMAVSSTQSSLLQQLSMGMAASSTQSSLLQPLSTGMAASSTQSSLLQRLSTGMAAAQLTCTPAQNKRSLEGAPKQAEASVSKSLTQV